jgi:hypothetical protein
MMLFKDDFYSCKKLIFFSGLVENTGKMQSYIDYLPIDVIRVYIMPHLNYGERFGLNMCIPTIDRIPTRMKKESIEKHDHMIRVPIIKKYLDRCFLTLGTETIKNMTLLFKLLQKPEYFRIIERSPMFRAVTITKIREFINSLIDFKGEVEIGTRLKLASELRNLRKKIDVSGPYTDIIYDHIEPLSFQ